MKKVFLIIASSVLLAACATGQNTNTKADAKDAIVGIWAMVPLRNGIANVVEFTKDGKSNVYPFNCRSSTSEKIESSVYAVSSSGEKIELTTEGETQELGLVAVGKKSMILSQDVAGSTLKFSYIRVNRISPLCHMYKGQKDKLPKKTAYVESDFIPDPWIPDHPNMARYVGAWADEKGAIQIEVRLDSAGKYKIFQESSENWNHLFNNVHWSGDELYFQSFAYSDKKNIFDHPYHKSNVKNILAPVDDANKIKNSHFIGGKRFDHILIRKSP